MIGVIGAGTMGTGIAGWFAQTGHEVMIWDSNHEVSASVKSRLQRAFDKRAASGKLVEDVEEVMARVHVPDDLGSFGRTDMYVIFEAVIEEMPVKQMVFSQVSAIVPEKTIIASNSSTMSITEMAHKVERPGRAVGAHFFHPVGSMKLVEIVRGTCTTEETIVGIERLLRESGKITVRVHKPVPGFIVNRVLVAQLLEALDLLERGVSTIEEIDLAVIEGLHYPMGPFRLMDFSGIDVVYRSLVHIYEDSGDPKFKPPRLLREKYLLKQWGQKTRMGFYEYPD